MTVRSKSHLHAAIWLLSLAPTAVAQTGLEWLADEVWRPAVEGDEETVA